MARGGKRPGAGRKPGSVNKRKSVTSAKALANGNTPLDIMLAAMRELFAQKQYSEAAMIAQRAAPYVHQKFTATQEPAKRHPEQVMQADLFDQHRSPPNGDQMPGDEKPDEFAGLLN